MYICREEEGEVRRCDVSSSPPHSQTHTHTHTYAQAVVSRAPEIRKDVEEAIREGSVDGLLTDGVKAVVRVCVCI
jgi:hypothetical protein